MPVTLDSMIRTFDETCWTWDGLDLCPATPGLPGGAPGGTPGGIGGSSGGGGGSPPGGATSPPVNPPQMAPIFGDERDIHGHYQKYLQAALDHELDRLRRIKPDIPNRLTPQDEMHAELKAMLRELKKQQRYAIKTADRNPQTEAEIDQLQETLDVMQAQIDADQAVKSQALWSLLTKIQKH